MTNHQLPKVPNSSSDFQKMFEDVFTSVFENLLLTPSSKPSANTDPFGYSCSRPPQPSTEKTPVSPSSSKPPVAAGTTVEQPNPIYAFELLLQADRSTDPIEYYKSLIQKYVNLQAVFNELQTLKTSLSKVCITRCIKNTKTHNTFFLFNATLAEESLKLENLIEKYKTVQLAWKAQLESLYLHNTEAEKKRTEQKVKEEKEKLLSKLQNLSVQELQSLLKDKNI